VNTQEGFDLLQLVADNASDWYDARQGPQVVVMSALLRGQTSMFKGCELSRNSRQAKALFNKWAAMYDECFLEGIHSGIVPRDASATIPPWAK